MANGFFGDHTIRSRHNKKWLFRITPATARNIVNTLKLEIPELEEIDDPILIFQRNEKWIWYAALDAELPDGKQLLTWLTDGILSCKTVTTRKEIAASTLARAGDKGIESVVSQFFNGSTDGNCPDIPIRTSSKSGYYMPQKGGTHEYKTGRIRWRSLLELAAYVKLDADPNTWTYFSESERIRYERPDTLTAHTYVADIYRLTSQGTPGIIEIKPACKVDDPVVQAKAKAAQSSQKIDFEFWTEKEIFGTDRTTKKYWCFRKLVGEGTEFCFADFQDHINELGLR